MENYNFKTGTVIDQVGDKSIIRSNQVLRNTYLLLSMTLLVSAIAAAVSMTMEIGFINPFITIIVYIGLLFGVNATKNSPIGILLTFALTGFLGFTIGPILNAYMTNFSNGGQLIMLALGGTAVIFFGLSAIAINPRKDFSKMGSFISIGFILAFIAIILNLFFAIPALSLAISVVVSLISGALIMYQTNMIVRGGEKNYIMATVTLYISILNIFLTLLQILGIFGGDD